MNLDEMLQLPEEDGVDDVLVLAPPCPASAPRLVPFIVLGLGLKNKRKNEYSLIRVTGNT